jgi:hypothetical protein
MRGGSALINARIRFHASDYGGCGRIPFEMSVLAHMSVCIAASLAMKPIPLSLSRIRAAGPNGSVEKFFLRKTLGRRVR